MFRINMSMKTIPILLLERHLYEQTYDFDVLNKLRRRDHKTGWLSPTGRLIPVESYMHVGYFVENYYDAIEDEAINKIRINPYNDPEITPIMEKEILQLWTELASRHPDEYDSYESSRDPEEIYGWHEWSQIERSLFETYGMRTLVVAYENGWGRVGYEEKKWWNRESRYADEKGYVNFSYLELEADQRHIKRLEPHAKEVATMLDAELRLTPKDIQAEKIKLEKR